MKQRPMYSTINMDSHTAIPKSWLMAIGLVICGLIVHFTIYGGAVVWPFVFGAIVLLLLNDASDRNGAGVPPLQVYGLFAATVVGFFAFIFLVRATLNPWLILLLGAGLGVYVFRDWTKRKKALREIERRQALGLCVRCATPVAEDVSALCPNCGEPAHAERLNLFRLGRAISSKADSSRARGVIRGTAPLSAASKRTLPRFSKR